MTGLLVRKHPTVNPLFVRGAAGGTKQQPTVVVAVRVRPLRISSSNATYCDKIDVRTRNQFNVNFEFETSLDSKKILGMRKPGEGHDPVAKHFSTL